MNGRSMSDLSEGDLIFKIPKAPVAREHQPPAQAQQHFYTPPDWSYQPPSGTYALEVIKEGKVIEQLMLEASNHFLFGRQRDICHIGMDHASISRVHAVINFHKDGSVLIMDMNSAHGTYINKNRLEPAKYTKLHINDVIKFGASTRMYIFKGPTSDVDVVEEEESAQLCYLRLKAEDRARKRSLAKEKALNSGISWGMDDEDDDSNDVYTSIGDEIAMKGGNLLNSSQTENDESERFRSQSRQHSLPEYLCKDQNYERKYGEQFMAAISDEDAVYDKDKATLEKIRKKEKKIQHMQEETRRIYLKEHNQNDGLTEGQLSVVQRNDASITLLKTEIEAMIHTIRSKHTVPPAIPKKRSIDEIEGEGRDTEGEVYDLSDVTADPNTNWRLRKKLSKHPSNHSCSSSSMLPLSLSSSSSLTYEEIQAQLLSVEAAQVQLSSSISLLQSSLTRDESLLLHGGHNEDEVGLLLIADRAKENKARLRRMNSEYGDFDRKVQRLKKMLIAATPALKSLVKPSASVTVNAAGGGGSSDCNIAVAFVGSTAAGGGEQGEEEAALHVTAQVEPATIISKKGQQHPLSTSSCCGDRRQRKLSIDDPEETEYNEDFERFISSETQTMMAVDDSEAAAALATIAPVPQSCSYGTSASAGTVRAVNTFSTAKNNSNYNNDNTNNAHSRKKGTTTAIKGPSLPPSPSPSSSNPPDNHMSSLETLAAMQRGQLNERQVSQGGDMIWVPPPSTKQKGDGKTALNDKYGY